MKDYSVLEGLDNNFMIELRCAYDRGYRQGRDDEWAETQAKQKENEYERGLNDAWMCAKKIISKNGEGYNATDLEVFGVDDGFELSALEAVERLKEYEKKHYDLPESMRGEINIGDEVRNMTNGCLGVVIKKAFEGYITVVSSWGNTYSWQTGHCNKTGKCYKQFAEAISSLQDNE
jgi:hypothetical protein